MIDLNSSYIQNAVVLHNENLSHIVENEAANNSVFDWIMVRIVRTLVSGS